MSKLQDFPDKEPVRFEDPNEEIDRMIEEKIESQERKVVKHPLLSLLEENGFERYWPYFRTTISCGYAFIYNGETRYFFHDIDIIEHLKDIAEKEVVL